MVLFGLLAGACGAPPPLRSSGSERSGRDVAVFSGVTADRFEGGRVRRRVRLERAELDRERRTLSATGVELESRGAAPRGAAGEAPVARARAARGSSELPPRELLLEGGVEVVDRAGTTLSASRMTYAVDAERLVAPGPVVVRGGNFEAHGGAMTVETASGAARLEGPLRARAW